MVQARWWEAAGESPGGGEGLDLTWGPYEYRRQAAAGRHGGEERPAEPAGSDQPMALEPMSNRGRRPLPVPFYPRVVQSGIACPPVRHRESSGPASRVVRSGWACRTFRSRVSYVRDR
ncbi:hypothetical protein GCM10009634_04740 [Saccharothrix xinjiangensis]